MSSQASSGEPMLSWIRRHLELTPDATDSDFWIARVVARDLGIDTFEVTLWRTELNPLGSTGTTPGGVPTPVGHAYSPNWPELGCRSPYSTIRALAAIC